MKRTTRTLRQRLPGAVGTAALLSTMVFAQSPGQQQAPPQQPPAGAGGQAGPAGPGGGGFGGGGGRGSGWSTSRGDAQRTGSVKNDAYISVDDLSKPGFGLEWTVTVGRTPGETLGEAVGNNTAQLNPAPGDIAGSANNVYGYEVDTGSIVWTRHLDVSGGGARTAACPGGLTAGVTRSTPLTGGVTGGALGRLGSPFGAMRGAVGAPGEGVPPEILARAGGRGRAAPGGAPGPAGANAPGAPGAAGAGAGAQGAAGANRGAAPPQLGDPAGRPGGPGGPGGGGRGSAPVYTITSDGLLRTIGQQEGKEIGQPTPFLPANARASSIVVVNQIVYATTINNCGGAADGVWALELNNRNAVKSWKSGASPVGHIAFSTTGTLFVALGDGPSAPGGRAGVAAAYANAIVALDPLTLAVQDWFTMPGASFSTSPVVFPVSGKEMVAAATKDGRVFLLDASSLGGGDHKTAVAVSAATNASKTWSPSALASWEDEAKTRWIALPATAGVTALKVNGNTLEPGWKSAVILASASAPIVVNDVVFALNEGAGSSPAVLYALDGSNGKEIWNSGKTLKSASRTPLWSNSGQVYVATTDRTLYAFGFAQERHTER